MTGTTNYAWPLIAESQSQKFQTHNDALQAIDTVVYGLSSSSGLTEVHAGTGIAVSVDSPPTTVTISADTTVLATHAYVTGLGYATLASPTFTGTPAAPTPTTSDDSTKIATTAFVKAQGYGTSSATGTVTSVAMTVPSDLSVAGSPITTTGTLAITRNTQNANLVMAGPTTGAAAAPTYRSLVAADLPTQPYDINFFAEGVLTTSEVVARFVVPRALSLASGASGVAICGTAPTTSSVTMTLAKNGTSIGTIVWATSATTGTVSITSTTTFVSGDIITLTGPSSVNAAFADPSVTLTATR